MKTLEIETGIKLTKNHHLNNQILTELDNIIERGRNNQPLIDNNYKHFFIHKGGSHTAIHQIHEDGTIKKRLIIIRNN